jgi:hypothetical protein
MDTEGLISLDDCAHVKLTFGGTPAEITCKAGEEIRYVKADSSGTCTVTEINSGNYGVENLTAMTTRAIGASGCLVGTVGLWKKVTCTAGDVTVSIRSAVTPRAS